MQKRRIIKQKILIFVSRHKLSIIILATLLLLFIVPPFINWVVSTDLGLGIGFITPENKDTWIGFYGGIIGGGITLGGVAWTLERQNKEHIKDMIIQERLANEALAESRRQFEFDLEQKNKELQHLKKQRNEDLAIQYKPYLSLLKPVNFGSDDIKSEFDEIPITNDEGFGLGKEYKEYCYIEMPLSIKNCGRGEAKISDISISHKWFDDDEETHLSYFKPILDVINPQESLYLTLRLWIYNYEKVVELERSYSYEIIIEYTDFLNSFTYSKELNLCLCYCEDESDKVLISKSSGDPLKKMVITVQ